MIQIPTLWFAALISMTISLAVLLLASLLINYKWGLVILDVQSAIEASLDIFDERYDSLSKLLEKDIFFDSPEVRRAIEDISMTRDAILYVANSMTAAIDTTAIEEQGE